MRPKDNRTSLKLTKLTIRALIIMTYPRDNFSSVLSLEEAIYNLKQIPILILLAQELLEGTSSIKLSNDDCLNYSLYLLELCEMQLKVVSLEFESIFFELHKGSK